jgi:hypothetical protein
LVHSPRCPRSGRGRGKAWSSRFSRPASIEPCTCPPQDDLPGTSRSPTPVLPVQRPLDRRRPAHPAEPCDKGRLHDDDGPHPRVSGRKSCIQSSVAVAARLLLIRVLVVPAHRATALIVVVLVGPRLRCFLASLLKCQSKLTHIVPFSPSAASGERGPFRDLGEKGHNHVRVAELKIAHSPMRILCGE